jgi:hypothetical protein
MSHCSHRERMYHGSEGVAHGSGYVRRGVGDCHSRGEGGTDRVKEWGVSAAEMDAAWQLVSCLDYAAVGDMDR